MNVLTDDLPSVVTIAGRQMPINTYYRAGIALERFLNHPEMQDDEKLERILRLYYGPDVFLTLDGARVLEEALEGIMWFYRCGVDSPVVGNTNSNSAREEPPFSYEYDAPYIYAAFMQAYKIDLTKEKLHWWQFRALFIGLPEDVQFCKIMGYRAMEIPPKMSKERKEFYRRMKKIYRIPESGDQIRLKEKLEAILAKGGDISQLMQ